MEEQEPSKQYLKGFNAGYTLEMYKPELMAKILPSIEVTNEYYDGLFNGSKIAIKDKERTIELKLDLHRDGEIEQEKGAKKAPSKGEHDMDKDDR